ADDGESSWAGLRPLIAEEGKSPDEISRKDEIFISDSGLISMGGGKVNGYRKKAEEAVDTVVEQLKKGVGILYTDAETTHLPSSGSEVGGSKGFEQKKNRKVEEATAYGLEKETAEKLVQT